nr:putative ribonuclease H-like domain-containing protein [Tanacetum cinerariifolium]
NTVDNAAFEVKEPEFKGNKPEFELYVSLTNSAKTKKHDDNTTKEAKGKSHVEFTNTFSDLGPSNTAVSPTHGKSSYVDASQYLDDANIPALEDITYFDDGEDVGAEVDFSNLETTITVSPILTTRVHKDHHEEVYVCQPLGFEDHNYPEKVYKVVKELYQLHQAPRAWYETLANYLLENGFQRRKIDQTLFIKKQKDDIMLLMKDKFQMSSMGELTFFLGLQVNQKPDGIFISHDKYVAEILRKFGLTYRKSASTPIDTEKPLLKDPDG